MSKKKKKKSWKERQRERQIKQQKAREAYRLQSARGTRKRGREWPMRKIVLVVSLIVILIGAYLVWHYIFSLEEPPQSGVIYIRADGSVNPSTAAILNTGNTIYTFTADVYDSVVIERNNIVVDGANHKLQALGEPKSDGIDLTGRRNVTITNLQINGFGNGIHFVNSFDITLSDNSINENQYDGIRLENSSNNILNANTITDNQFDGIVLYSSSSTTLSGNTVTGNQYDGIHLEFSHDNTISGNNVVDNKDDGAHLRNSSDNTLSGNTITNNNNSGVYLNSAPHNVFSQNNLANNNDGFLLEYSPYNTLNTNIMAGNDHSGAYFFSASHSIISENNLANNVRGIVFEQSSNNTFSGNTLVDNQQGVAYYNSPNNRNYYNNFIDNAEQVNTYESPNIWDDGYPSGGNYWSDYNGTDLQSGPYQNETGNDGIGDTVYFINASNTDNHPLTGMFQSFNIALEYNVQSVCSSIISGFQFNGTAISFNVIGEDGTTGACRIRVPTALMNGSYKVFVSGTEVPFTLLPFSNSTHNYLYFTYHHSTLEITITSQ
ncbi:MAG: right-handed parallel beta-helix repeat-containing protein [Candidatus Bathyarchaeota archaeon]|nr:MAG: right-handed parallel beta-helix repeat-containing protein [Candidatus Bathyarchaeota archaeon]